MTSEARDKIRELRLVAAQCHRQAAAAIEARDMAIRNLGEALLDVPAGDWPGAVVGPIDGDHVGCGPVTHNLARWPRVPAVEPPPVVNKLNPTIRPSRYAAVCWQSCHQSAMPKFSNSWLPFITF